MIALTHSCFPGVQPHPYAQRSVRGPTAWVWFLLDQSFWVRALLTIFVVMPITSLSNFSFRADVRRRQRRREAAAEDVARRVIDDERTGDPFTLYLRPFATTNRLASQPSAPEFAVGEITVHLDLETLLERALRSRCPVVALGRPGDIAEGAARIITTSEDDWRAVMTALARRAAFIVITPLARPSTTWELRWLAEHDLLGKVLMIMPETKSGVPDAVVQTTMRGDKAFDGGFSLWNPEEHKLDLAQGMAAGRTSGARDRH
jgi:hypothetical protein